MAQRKNPPSPPSDKVDPDPAELRERERKWAASQAILEKAMARLALFGFDQDPELDAPLSELRAAIRAGKEPQEIAEHAHQVEATIRRLGLPRDSGPRPDLPGEVLLRLLDRLSLPRRLDPDRRQLRQQLRQAPKENPPDQLMADLITLIEEAGEEAPAPKGLRGLFGGGGAGRAANAGRPLRILLDELIAPAELRKDLDRLHADLAEADEDEAAEAAERLAQFLNDLLTGTPPATPELRRPLNRLLSTLAGNEEEDATEGAVQQLRDRISAGPPTVELPGILDSTADLAADRTEAFEQERQDLEHFLQQVVDHLNDLGLRFEATSSIQEAAREQARQHDHNLHAQMDGLETDLQRSEDLQSLKETVRGRMDKVRQRLEAHREAEEERDRELEAEVAALRTRLTEMEKESEELRERLHQEWLQAHTDALTGLPNRLGYEEKARALLSRHRQEGGRLSVAVMDIDLFKDLNDNFGHQAGDKALKIIAGILQDHLPADGAFLARYGGEEFVCLFPGQNREGAVQAVEQMRRKVGEAAFTFQQQRIRITLSAGVDELRGEESIKAAFGRADRALLQAKEAGRDTVVAADAEGAE